jgi:hypothetical protein
MDELNGTKYLEMMSKDPMIINTKEGLNKIRRG